MQAACCPGSPALWGLRWLLCSVSAWQDGKDICLSEELQMAKALVRQHVLASELLFQDVRGGNEISPACLVSFEAPGAGARLCRPA